MDVTENEVPDLEMKGYPTIRLYPKNKKNQPIDYDGGRDLEEIKKWLAENSRSYSDFIHSNVQARKDL